MRTGRSGIVPYVTRDGSLVRELMHPAEHGNRCQSLAEATVAPGGRTQLHHHRLSEELYHVIRGSGRMTLARETFDIRPGDTVCITPGTAHCLENTGQDDLVVLCCCSPPYSHEDTILLE